MIYLITRHPGAVEWLEKELAKHPELTTGHLDICRLTHLGSDVMLHAGDVVVGILPVNKVAELQHKKVRYFHLAIDLPEKLRGKELGAEELDQLGATLSEYLVIPAATG